MDGAPPEPAVNASEPNAWAISHAAAPGCARTTGAPPPIFAINGKRDNIVGWAEKLPFYQAMANRRLGGCFLWDPQGHMDTQAWTVDVAYLRRLLPTG